MTALARIELDPSQPQSIEANPNGAFSEARGVVEQKALAPLFLGIGVCVAGVLVDVEVAQAEVALLSSTKPAAPACWARMPSAMASGRDSGFMLKLQMQLSVRVGTAVGLDPACLSGVLSTGFCW